MGKRPRRDEAGEESCFASASVDAMGTRDCRWSRIRELRKGRGERGMIIGSQRRCQVLTARDAILGVPIGQRKRKIKRETWGFQKEKKMRDCDCATKLVRVERNVVNRLAPATQSGREKISLGDLGLGDY